MSILSRVFLNNCAYAGQLKWQQTDWALLLNSGNSRNIPFFLLLYVRMILLEKKSNIFFNDIFFFNGRCLKILVVVCSTTPIHLCFQF